MQFSEQATEFNMPRRRDFLLISKKQHLVREKSLPDLVEFLCCYAIGE